MKKRGFPLLLAILILAAQIPFAFAVTASGTCGDNLTWTLDDSGTLIISGTGTMDNYGGWIVINERSTPWYSYRNEIYKSEIAQGVTSIGEAAFVGCGNLTNITIPNSVADIRAGAFYDCDNLTDIAIPNSVVGIENSTFGNCKSLASVTMPASIRNIGYGAFSHCYNLTNITIPSNVTAIGDWAFSCSGLTNITIPNSVTSIGEGAFNACSGLTNVTISNSVTTIGNSAFRGCENLTNVTIPNSVTTIGEEAFGSCGLTNVTIPNSVTVIGNSAFRGCDSLTSVTIPNGVTAIGEQTFRDCGSLTNVTIPNSVTTIGDLAFSSCNSLTNITIPNSVISIKNSVCSRCDNLTSVTIPTSVTSIGDSAFYFCPNLENVYYSGSQNQWETVEIGFSNEDLTNATIHYNSAAPDSEPVAPPEPVTPTPLDPEPVAPTPIEPAPQINSEISKYSYTFDNSAKSFGYAQHQKVPLEGFQMMFGDALGKKILDAIFDGKYWNGNCYGMATSAAMLTRVGSTVEPSDFRNGATRPGELQVSDNNSQWNLTLARFIEAMQASQYGATFASAYKQNLNNLSGLRLAMSAFEEGGLGSLVICVHGLMDGYYSGHALLAYHLDGQRLYVYDCNHPNDGNRYITISENGWSYPLFDNVTWDSSDGEITYIPYETYLFDWYNRGHLLGDQKYLPKEMLIIDDANVTISDSSGHEVATFRKGKMVSGIDEAYPIPHLGVTVDGVSASRPPIAVWLPYSNEYKVTTRENATVSAVSVNRDVSVNRAAKGGQTVSVSLASSAPPKFEDVSSGQYFYDPVQWAVGRGITNGTTVTTFSPHNTCTRNHILTFLWRANGSPAATIRNPFSDIDVSGDFGKAAVWAYEKGLVSGKQFNGGTPCSRADVVTYLWKLAGRPSAGRNSFKDVPSNADYAQAVSWAVERGITNGTSQTTFNPSGICTRGQIVTFLYRAYVEN